MKNQSTLDFTGQDLYRSRPVTKIFGRFQLWYIHTYIQYECTDICKIINLGNDRLRDTMQGVAHGRQQSPAPGLLTDDRPACVWNKQPSHPITSQSHRVRIDGRSVSRLLVIMSGTHFGSVYDILNTRTKVNWQVTTVFNHKCCDPVWHWQGRFDDLKLYS